jgi:hypothetical protein
MKKFYFLALMAIVAVSCQREVEIIDPVSIPTDDVVQETTSVNVRSYDEALAIAEEALQMVDGEDTRSGHKRTIKRDEGQIVMSPVTRNGEAEPIMYVFNNENNEGFTIVAAQKNKQPLIAVTESGNYTYGEPTGVAPFDLLMEDLARDLIIDIPNPISPYLVEIENELHKGYESTTNIKWGTEAMYGAYYPDGVAYDEAAAIAQALMSVHSDITYEITNPNSPLYGQTINMDKAELKNHIRYDHFGQAINLCNDDTHQKISLLYLEIGYRLSNGTNISLANKNSSFTIDKIRDTYASFGPQLTGIYYFNGETITPRVYTFFHTYRKDIFVFNGYTTSLFGLPEGGYAHTWIATGFDDYTYDVVKYTQNRMLDPNHPLPDEYTETSRETKRDFMLWMNWGYDGISNGWFHSGCFDMSNRVNESTDGFIITEEYDYNFDEISYFSALEYPLTDYPLVGM